jgi:hypothetical protein
MLTVGSEVSLWQPLLLDWVLWMRQSLRDVALRVHVDVPQDLANQVTGGLVDVAIMYAPQHWPRLKIDFLRGKACSRDYKSGGKRQRARLCPCGLASRFTTA